VTSTHSASSYTSTQPDLTRMTSLGSDGAKPPRVTRGDSVASDTHDNDHKARPISTSVAKSGLQVGSGPRLGGMGEGGEGC
jgi:hypothetical protein